MPMFQPTHEVKTRIASRGIRSLGFALIVIATAHWGSAQDTPLISGGGGFFSSTNGGNTSYLPIIEPLIAAPIGPHILVESRATLLESFSPNGGGQTGYNHSHFIATT
jgi:hypothetical protein